MSLQFRMDSQIRQTPMGTVTTLVHHMGGEGDVAKLRLKSGTVARLTILGVAQKELEACTKDPEL